MYHLIQLPVKRAVTILSFRKTSRLTTNEKNIHVGLSNLQAPNNINLNSEQWRMRNLSVLCFPASSSDISNGVRLQHVCDTLMC